MPIEAGQQLVHYRLIEKIGEGGMGVVWKAEDTRLHRLVALKFVPERQSSDQQVLDRHLREARAASSLNHPNICSIHDIGEWEGRRFIVMELLEGQPLDDRIGGTPMEIHAAVELATQMADALHAAHAKGIVHRDVKPANIFVTGNGAAKILDFGLAKLAAEGRTDADDATRTKMDPTLPGTVVGTVAYMSPEQALGKELDPRTDIFSFGVVLYEMLTGRRAFAGSTSAAVFDAILNRAPTAPVTFNPEVPVELQRIVNKALEKDTALRYQSVAEICADLKRLRRDPSVDRPATPTTRAGRLWLGLISVLVVLGIVAAITIRFQQWNRPEAGLDVAGAETPSGPSIAVLPFTNASGDPEQEYFSAGLTEDIINGLALYRELSVIAKLATTDYKSKHAETDVRDAGKALGARYVLQGSVFKQAERIRVSVQLSDSTDGRSVWGTSYDRELTATDLFAIQDDVRDQVVNAIGGMYGVLSRAKLQSLRRKPPESLDSYACVVLGYEYLYLHTNESHLKARECLEEAVAAEPGYAEAVAWLAYIYAEEYHHRRNERADQYNALDRALELALESVRLDSASHVTHGFLTFVYFFRGDYERGRVEGTRTIALMPANAMWLGVLGIYLTQLEDFESGIPMLQRARELDPVPPAWLEMGFFYDQYMQGRYEEALETALKIELGDDFRTSLLVAAAYGQLGRMDAAAPELQKLREELIVPVNELRAELIDRHAMSPGLVDHILEGLTKAGLDLNSRE